MPTIQNLEIHTGLMAKQIAKTLSENFSANTITNPKEHCINVVIEKEEKHETEGEKDEKEREKKIN